MQYNVSQSLCKCEKRDGRAKRGGVGGGIGARQVVGTAQAGGAGQAVEPGCGGLGRAGPEGPGGPWSSTGEQGQRAGAPVAIPFFVLYPPFGVPGLGVVHSCKWRERGKAQAQAINIANSILDYAIFTVY